MKRPRDGDWGEETGFQIRNRDATLSAEQYASLPKFPVHLVLDNLRSAFNVGSLFRTADTARIAEIITCGYTAHPPHPRLEKTALGTLDFVAHRHYSSALEAVAYFRGRDTPVWAVETTSRSRSYTDLAFPRPIALVLGNEALGVDREVLDSCDEIIEIPVFGYKNSLNVASAGAVVLFEILRQWSAPQISDAGV